MVVVVIILNLLKGGSGFCDSVHSKSITLNCKCQGKGGFPSPLGVACGSIGNILIHVFLSTPHLQ